jgi:hypothetical protein
MEIDLEAHANARFQISTNGSFRGNFRRRPLIVKRAIGSEPDTRPLSSPHAKIKGGSCETTQWVLLDAHVFYGSLLSVYDRKVNARWEIRQLFERRK